MEGDIAFEEGVAAYQGVDQEKKEYDTAAGHFFSTLPGKKKVKKSGFEVFCFHG